MNSDQKIMIIRFSSIGDILLASPFIRQTRIAFPHATIDFVVKKRFSQLLRFNPHLNHLYEFDETTGLNGLIKLRKKIREKQYDIIFDLHNNIRSRILTFGQKGKIFRIKKGKLRRALLVYFKLNTYKEAIPIPERYLKVGQKAGVKDDFNGLEIFWKNHYAEGLSTVVDNRLLKSDFIVVAPGAGFKTKQWPLIYFRQLLEMVMEKTPYKVVLLGSEKERDEFRMLEVSERIFNYAGKLSILESAIVMSHAKFAVTNDSGLMHMATSVNTPVAAIFGSTTKELGFFPYRARHKVIENPKVWCRPCSHIGRNKCPLIHFKCMRSITPQDVFEEIKDWL